METKCSDPWGTTENSNESEIQFVLTRYLKSEFNVSVVYISTVLLPIGIFCPDDACTCITGRQVNVTVEEGFAPILKANGFELIE